MTERQTTITQTYTPIPGRSVTVRDIPAHEVCIDSESEIMLDFDVVERVQVLVDRALTSSAGDNLAVTFDPEKVPSLPRVFLVGSMRQLEVSEALSGLIARVAVVERLLQESFTIDIATEHVLPSLFLRSGSSKAHSALYIAYLCIRNQHESLSVDADAGQLDKGLAALRLLASGSRNWISVWLQDNDLGIQLDEHVAASVRSCRIRLRSKSDPSVREASVIATIEEVQQGRFAARCGRQMMEFRYDESLKPDIFQYIGASARIFYAKYQAKANEALDVERLPADNSSVS
jgi:hypothetical protein